MEVLKLQIRERRRVDVSVEDENGEKSGNAPNLKYEDAELYYQG